MTEQSATYELEMDTRIAVTGIALRLPGARTLDEFWNLLLSGENALKRFDPAGMPGADHPDYVPVHGAIPGIDRFDARLFGLSPREAELIDPQQRMLLQLAWEALEHGALHPGNYGGRVGVFAGTGSNQYLRSQLLSWPEGLEDLDDHTLLLASEKDFCAGRIAYKLNLTGPALSLQTACSTGLVAVHSAVQHLLGGECDAALAGACSLQVPQEKGYRWRKGGILSRSGACRPFDHRADGTVGGSGGAMLVLKRLGDALEDRDTVYGVITGSAVNNDGSGKAGFTAPSVGGQSAVMREALLAAGVEPREVDYVEAHGTGTEVGDPIELTALAQVYGAGRVSGGNCRVGAVKALTGHLDTASGLTGLLKALLALRHRRIPGNPFFEKPNPRFEWEGSGLHINRQDLAWQRGEGPRRAGVSSLGLGGTNAHLILEEPPLSPDPGAAGPHPLLLPLSAESPEALQSLQHELDGRLLEGEFSPADAAFTLQEGRRPLSWRSFRLAGEADHTDWKTARKVQKRQEAETASVFLFPGQGAQYPGMGAELYAALPAFRAEADRLCALADPLMDGLCSAFFKEGRTFDTLARSQTCMLALQLALASWWRRAGLEPGWVMGHSLGEYAAACVAGVLSEEEALTLVHARGELIDGLPPGGMVTVLEDWETLSARCGGDLHPAAFNAPGIVTVSGETPAVQRLEEELTRDFITFVPLDSHRAFHSPAMEEIAEEYLGHLRRVSWREPRIPWLSTATAEKISTISPDYWISQMRHPVRFSEACGSLAGEGDLRFVEVGPGSQLSGLVRRNGLCRDRESLLVSLEAQGEVPALLRALGQSWMQGAPVRWEAARGREGRRIALPAYPFAEESYWFGPPAGKEEAESPAGPLTCRRPAWERGEALPDPGQQRDGDLLVLGGERARAWAEDEVNVSCLPLSPEGDLLQRLSHSPKEELPRLLFLPEEGEDGRGPWMIYHLLQRLNELKTKESISLTLFTSNAFEVTGEELLSPDSAAAAALLRAAAREFPALRLSVVDSAGPLPADLLRALLDEGEAEVPAGSCREIVCRGSYRWKRVFRDVDLPPSGARKPRPAAPAPGEACLVTGGAGALGLHLASWLLARDAPVFLLGRRSLDELPPETLREMEQLKSHGAALHYLEGDVRKPASLKAARLEAEKTAGEIRHLYHLAGIAAAPGSGGLSERDFLDALAVKGGGLDHLLDIVDPGRLASLTLYSSQASFESGLAGPAYAAASADMDARALRRVPRSRLRIINWGGWREIGMGEELAAEADLAPAQLDHLRKGALSPSEGRAALDRLAGLDGPRFLVVKSTAQGNYGKPHPRDKTTEAAHARPSLHTPYEEPGNETQRRLAAIWQEALGVERVGIDDNFFDLGADSLLMIRVMESVNRSLDADLDKTDLFEHTTVRKLAAHMGRSGRDASPADASRKRADKQRQALARQSALARQARKLPNRNEDSEKGTT